MNSLVLRGLVFVLVLFQITINANSQEKKGILKDTLDGKLDASEWLQKQSGFLPFMGIITEPALDYGLTLGAIFFEPFSKYEGKTLGGMVQEKGAPPDIAAIVGFGTLNESWGVALAYRGFWLKDRLRYKGALLWIDVNLDYYGNGQINLSSPVTLNYPGLLILQELSARMAKKLYGGFSYTLFRFKLTPSHEVIPPDWNLLELDALSSTITPLVFYDGRDNIFTPDRGIYAKLLLNLNGDYIGSDFDYQMFESIVFGYIPVGRSYNIGLRYTGKFSSSGTPFFAKPFIELRGIPLMRYQGLNILELETEQRFRIGNRWDILGFLGYGKSFYDKDSFSENPNIFAGGLGFRYLIARAYKMSLGLDFARGPEDFAFYITIGSYWGKY